jgi:hypothetical protein
MNTQNLKQNSKKIIFSGLLFITQTLSAQVSINNTDFPNGGDTCLISISNQTTLVDYSTTGANQIWDFSYLEANSQRIDTFYNVNNSSLLYQASFNNWLLAPDYNSDYYNKLINNNLPTIPGGTITLENPVFFSKNSTSKFEIVGIGVEVNGIEVPVQSDTIDVVYDFPMTYNDSWNSRSYFNIDMNPIYDAQFKRHQQRDVIVDGWGQITTPFGDFDAIRVKTILTYQDSIYIDLPLIGASWLAIPTPETIEYNWWTTNNKVPVLKITTQAGIATTIEYRDGVVNDFASTIEEQLNYISLFPNPTSTELTINVSEVTPSLIEILDLNGKLMYSTTLTGNIKINVSNWTKGVYFVKMKNNSITTTQNFIVN